MASNPRKKQINLIRKENFKIIFLYENTRFFFFSIFKKGQ